ncbi:MAG TPA: protein-disulfide reductase DsbD [Noviherbaspirillum sp.]
MADRDRVIISPAGIAALLLALFVMLFAPLAAAKDDFLPPEEAFRFSAKTLDSNTAEVTYGIADGYYMYREQFAFSATGARLGTPSFPKGKVKFDDAFQKDVETYRGSVTIRVPFEASGAFTLKATSQGCADAGLCYPPMQSSIALEVGSTVTGTNGGSAAPLPRDEMGAIESSLKSRRLTVIAPLFLLLGLGLAFTPCVLPMVPILSSIIVGDKAGTSRWRGLALSAAYSLGMAIVYTLLGIGAGLAGEGLAATLQNPWVLGAFALLMVALSLSMFDLYTLQMPAFVQERLLRTSEKQAAGKFAGVFVMGALSALIVGPCVAAPLAGALVYISSTRDVLIGGGALFSMAVGMSIPLLLVGLSAGTLLPRAGAWMDSVKRFFGVLMLATAWWMVSPVIPARMQMAGWAILGVGYAAYLFRPSRRGVLVKGMGLVFAGFGAVQAGGLVTGGQDPLAPLAHLDRANSPHVEFVRVTSVADLEAAVARSSGKTVMLDFYADWCVSCKEMEKLTFSDPRVQRQFAEMVLLQADVTANNANDKALLKRFGLFGPPGIIFFDPAGRELPRARVVGYQNADRFLESLSVARTVLPGANPS